MPSRLLGACLLLGATGAAAQETSDPSAPTGQPELVTDRPDQTESTAIVPPGRAQLELGMSFVSDQENGARLEAVQVPGALLRLGLTERIELRLGWDGYLQEEARFHALHARDEAFGDAELGAKVRLRNGAGSAPEIALLVATSIPTGEDPFTSDRFDPSFRLAFAQDLGERVGLGYNFGASWESVPAGAGRTTVSTAIYTLAAGFAAGERWGLFVEAFGDVPLSAGGGPAHSLDGGVTYLLRPNLQLDLAAGAGLSDDAPDWFAGVGVSVRLPR